MTFFYKTYMIWQMRFLTEFMICQITICRIIEWHFLPSLQLLKLNNEYNHSKEN